MSCIRFYSAKYLLLDTTRHHLVIIYDSASVSTIDKAIYNFTLSQHKDIHAYYLDYSSSTDSSI